jgi:hypothetical protein
MIDNLKNSETLIYENQKSDIKVYEYIKENGAKYLSYRICDGTYEQSGLYPDEVLRDQISLSYVCVPHCFEAKNYLILGLGAGGNLRQLEVMGQDITAIGVDINEESIGIAKKYFGVKEEGNELVLSDARTFLEHNTKFFNCIIIDIFDGDGIPEHCVTKEFFELAYNSLASCGVLVVNSNMIETYYPIESYVTVPRPCRHLHSTMFHAGFQSLFQNDLHSLGIIYAFKNEITEAGFYRKLYSVYETEHLDENLKAAIGAAISIAVNISKENSGLVPYTDEDALEHVLNKKSARKDISLAISEKSEREVNEIIKDIDLSKTNELAKIVSKYIVSNWRDGKYGFVIGTCEYYEKIIRHYSDGADIKLQELCRYLPITFKLESFIPKSPENKKLELLRDYVKGLNLVRNDEGKEAIVHFDRALPILLKSYI